MYWPFLAHFLFPFKLLNQLTDVHEIWYERYVTGGHPSLVHFCYLQPAVTTWRTRELVRWERHILFTEITYCNRSSKNVQYFKGNILQIVKQEHVGCMKPAFCFRSDGRTIKARHMKFGMIINIHKISERIQFTIQQLQTLGVVWNFEVMFDKFNVDRIRT